LFVPSRQPGRYQRCSMGVHELLPLQGLHPQQQAPNAAQVLHRPLHRQGRRSPTP